MVDYLSEFHPRPETVQLHDAVALELEQLDRRIKTSSNIPSKALAEQLMTILLAFQQWIVSQGQDLADYSQAVGARLDNVGGGLNDEDLEVLVAIHEHLTGLQKLFEEAKALLPPSMAELGVKNAELTEALGDIIAVQTEGDDDEDEDEDPDSVGEGGGQDLFLPEEEKKAAAAEVIDE